MSTLPRRRFVAALAAAPWLTQAARAAHPEPRVLSFAHLHTGERLELEYARGADYLPDALAAVNHLLRDFRNGEVGTMDPALLDLLFTLHGRLGSRRPFEIISGYRSPATNRMLHERSSGVASGSLHMSGRAIDVRLADVSLERLRDTALGLGGGGVGYYAASNFVHVDTGRVRRW